MQVGVTSAIPSKSHVLPRDYLTLSYFPKSWIPSKYVQYSIRQIKEPVLFSSDTRQVSTWATISFRCAELSHLTSARWILPNSHGKRNSELHIHLALQHEYKVFWTSPNIYYALSQVLTQTSSSIETLDFLTDVTRKSSDFGDSSTKSIIRLASRIRDAVTCIGIGFGNRRWCSDFIELLYIIGILQ